MKTLAIEINDAALVLASADSVLATEPGFALVENGVIVAGQPAYGQARLKPRQVSNRYWSELSLDPSSAVVQGVRNAAELAFAQLEGLWKGVAAEADEVVLVVPSHYSGEQLGLLLGLAQECGMAVRAMVDVAAAASERAYPGRDLLYVDAGLHRVSVTPLEQGDDVSALPEQALEAIGLASLTDSFAKRLAEMFVLATRFDPFHRAESEQLLYDRLEAWLAELRERDSAEISLPHGGEDVAVEVKREQLLGVAAGFYRALVQLIAQARRADARLIVQLSDRLARLPGLSSELARLDAAEIVRLPPGHAARAVLKQLDALPARGAQVKLLRHLAWREQAMEQPVPAAAPKVAAKVKARAPTHVVYRGVAYAIDGKGLLIGRAQGGDRRVIVIDDQTGGVSRSHCELSLRDGELRLRDLSSFGTFVNERRVAGEETLHPADVIRIGSPGAELQVVTMEHNDGA